MPARQALELATRRGAEALGLGDRIGSLEPGKQADIITVAMDGARQTPMFDPRSHLVYVSRGADVRTTIVAGKVLMRDRQVLTLSPKDVLRDARAMAARVLHGRRSLRGREAGQAAMSMTVLIDEARLHGARGGARGRDSA